MARVTHVPNNAARKKFEVMLAGLGKKQGKVGWDKTAKYQDGTPVALAAMVNELGSAARSIPARPFFRPTIAREFNNWAAIAAQGAKAVVAGTATMEDVLNAIGSNAMGQVQKTIASITSPPLSPLTLMARKHRRMGGMVTGKTIGEFAKQLDKGPQNLAGVSTKPLEDTFTLYNTITHTVEDTP